VKGYEVQTLAFHYGEQPALNGVNLTLQAGRFYGILGPNGSGKSTLLDLLMGYRRPSQGSVRLDGRPVEAFSGRELARRIALVPQNFYIQFPYRAEEVVMMGRYPHIPRFTAPAAADHAIVEAVMAQTGVAQFRSRLITELSGGERQRVVFARALAQEAEILLLDEATASMDIRHSLDLLKLSAQGVREQGRTVIAVFHDLNLAAGFCDDLIFLKAGRVAIQGAAGNVLSSQTLEEVFQVQARVFYDAYADAPQVAFRY
jgi:iron complex transport system ATP-binding protein